MNLRSLRSIVHGVEWISEPVSRCTVNLCAKFRDIEGVFARGFMTQKKYLRHYSWLGVNICTGVGKKTRPKNLTLLIPFKMPYKMSIVMKRVNIDLFQETIYEYCLKITLYYHFVQWGPFFHGPSMWLVFPSYLSCLAWYPMQFWKACSILWR